jgi:hypothetical protein
MTPRTRSIRRVDARRTSVDQDGHRREVRGYLLAQELQLYGFSLREARNETEAGHPL